MRVHQHDADAAVVVRIHAFSPAENHSAGDLREPETHAADLQRIANQTRRGMLLS
jgi:hypothetical protein